MLEEIRQMFNLLGSV